VPQSKQNPANTDRRVPTIAGQWYAAAACCNWLSAHQGIPKEQSCYIPNQSGAYADGMTILADALEHTGYRLPSEPEWECACRAGTATSRYFGTVRLIDAYARHQGNSEGHAWTCRSLLPNDLSLFDMLGNLVDWCHSRQYNPYHTNIGILVEYMVRAELVADKNRCPLRGCAFGYPAAYIRSVDSELFSPQSSLDHSSLRAARTLKRGTGGT
jgi:formylglycine-generating enzyme required for sulfatase activity